MVEDLPAKEVQPLLSYDEFVACERIAPLIERYRTSGVEGSDEQVLTRVQRDWWLAALDHARKVERSPERFEPDCGSLDGVEVRVWGLYHGMAGGNERDYKAFIDASLDELGEVLFENGVGYFYSPASQVTVPDFAVMFPLGSIRLGFYVGLRFPFLFWELIRDLLKIGRSAKASLREPYSLSPRYHSLPVEARRGIEEDPPLPTKLMVDYELSAWESHPHTAAWRYHFAIVPRSMFMAAFAYGYAKSRGQAQVDMVVGDLHTGEILHFLADPPREHALWKLGESYGRAAKGARRARVALIKVAHLGLSAGIGAPLLVGMIVLLYWAFLYLRSLAA